MGWSLGFIENGTEEVADAARFFYIIILLHTSYHHRLYYIIICIRTL